MRPLSLLRPVLAIEASTSAGSVALWLDGELAGADAVAMGAGRDDALFPAIVHQMSSHGVRAANLAAVVCGGGPGSFTSLRIAASIAKGLAYGATCELYAAPSLLLAAASFVSTNVGAPQSFVVHADALRGERYVLPVHRDAAGDVVASGALARVPAEQLERSVPPSARLAVLASPFTDDAAVITPTVAALPRAGGGWRSAPVSLADWEPEYGRLAEAQVQWEERHGAPLPAAPAFRS